MHQYQLVAFAFKFGMIPPENTPPSTSFTAEEYDSLYSFIPPKKSHRKLTNTEFKHLQQHYRTVHSIASIHDPELVNMDHDIQIWHRCCLDKTVYHCAQYQRRNSTRLNHLVCIEQMVDANANFSYRSRPERMIPVKFYAYVQFYCVHTFREQSQMLMYSSYRKVHIHDGLVEDKGHHLDGFQDLHVLQYMCAKVTGAEGKVYFVDERETMEERLRDALLK